MALQQETERPRRFAIPLWKKKPPAVTIIGDGTRRADVKQLMADEKVRRTLEELAVRFKHVPGPAPPSHVKKLK